MAQNENASNELTDDVSRETDPEKREKFGTRFLTDPQSVFQHNAWDNVVWDEEQETMAQQIAEKHNKCFIPEEKRDQYESEADQFWDKFYGQHQNRFFKDRHWLFTEFPELYGRNRKSSNSSKTSVKSEDGDSAENVCEKSMSHKAEKQVSGDCTASPERSEGSCDTEEPGDGETGQAGTFDMLEVGCGVGNTVFPVLQTNNQPNLKVYCCDFSKTAIDIVKNHPDYDPKRCHAFVYDITDDTTVVPFPPESLDVIIMIFVLSAVNPDKMQPAINRLASYLKPGGMLLFRDYGRYDMAQLRFKEGRCLSENFYVRGDGTRVYFFTQDELREMFTRSGLEEKENLVDRRLQVNRGRQLKMYRVWIQCKYIKTLSESNTKSQS